MLVWQIKYQDIGIGWQQSKQAWVLSAVGHVFQQCVTAVAPAPHKQCHQILFDVNLAASFLHARSKYTIGFGFHGVGVASSRQWFCKKWFTLLDLCVSSLRRGHANLLCIVPILTDDPRRESISSKPKNETTETVQINKTIKTLRKPVKIT